MPLALAASTSGQRRGRAALLEAVNDEARAACRRAGRDRAGWRHRAWPGRSKRSVAGCRVLLDAAHNPAGARALASYLADARPDGVTLVFGAMQDKAIARCWRRCAQRPRRHLHDGAEPARSRPTSWRRRAAQARAPRRWPIPCERSRARVAADGRSSSRIDLPDRAGPRAAGT
jgi:hypothetical protein